MFIEPSVEWDSVKLLFKKPIAASLIEIIYDQINWRWLVYLAELNGT